MNYGVSTAQNYLVNKVKQSSLKSFFPVRKRDREGEVIVRNPPVESFDSEMAGYRRKAVGSGGVWQGKFPGSVKRPRKDDIRNCFKETVLYAGQHSADGVNYLGLLSMPAYEDPSRVSGLMENGCRVLTDINISILRYFFRNCHPGHFEFESSDQRIRDLMLPGTANDQTETFRLTYRSPTGGAQQTGTPFSILSAISNFTLRTLAVELTGEMMYFWKRGYEPSFMQCYINIATGVPPYVSVTGALRLDQLIVKAVVKNVLKLQNGTLAEVGDAAGDADLTTNILSNPVRGKILYFKGLAPVVNTGYDATATVQDDEWFQNNLRIPNDGTIRNLITPSVKPVGGWATIPRASYFKNCIGEKDVTLEPGAQRSFTLGYKFSGYLSTLLQKLYTAYGTDAAGLTGTTTHAGFSHGTGSCAVVCFEKRIRTGDTPVVLDFQLDTHIMTTVVTKKHIGMIHHVEANVD